MNTQESQDAIKELEKSDDEHIKEVLAEHETQHVTESNLPFDKLFANQKMDPTKKHLFVRWYQSCIFH